MTSSDTITAAQWRDLRLRAWKYQLGNRPNMERFRVEELHVLLRAKGH